MTASESIIQKAPGVVGGQACVRNTRIAVWMLVESKRFGRTDDDLLADHSGLTRGDLSAAWAYFASHAEEIEAAIRANNDAE